MLYPVFKVISTDHSDTSLTAVLTVDADSDIFKGHFPEQPVVPGACMLQTVKEILEDKFATSLRLVKADNIKFLTRVIPGAGNLTLQINYQEKDSQLSITASLAAEETVFMKMKGSFTRR